MKRGFVWAEKSVFYHKKGDSFWTEKSVFYREKGSYHFFPVSEGAGENVVVHILALTMAHLLKRQACLWNLSH